MLKKGDTFTVNIIKQDHFDNGIAKIDDFLLFVKQGLPGDQALIKVTSVNKHYARADIIKLLTMSRKRVEPICPFYNICGGCQIMHEHYQEQLAFKEAKVTELFERNFEDNIKINHIISDEALNYRNKVTLHVKNGQIGYYQAKSNDLVVIDKCVLLHPLLNKYLLKIKKLLTNENSEIMMRVSFDNEEILISIEGEFKKLDKLKKEDISLYYNNQLIKGKGYIIEKLNNMSFRLNHKSFFQVNPKMAAKLYEQVTKLSAGSHQVLDLYCGVGGMGLLVSKKVKHVTGIEIVEEAIKEANKNKEINIRDNVDFIAKDVKNIINQLSNIDLVIVDPPREGLTDDVINGLKQINSEKIIYVSCDLNTLIRDLKKLSANYEIKSVDIFDMFPNTYHVECVSVLDLKGAIKTLKNREKSEILKNE